MRKQIIALFYTLVAALSLAMSPFAYAADCPLCSPASNGDLVEVHRLLAAGADVNAKHSGGWTALRSAVSGLGLHSHPEVVKLLLNAGADPDAVKEDTDTALIRAVKYDDESVARILLDAGANPSAKGKHGLTALYYAEKNGNAILLRWLKEADSFWWKIKKRFSSL